jgi:predicted amidohydrolase
MSKETNKDSLINFAKELDKLNDVNITLKGNIEAILDDPLAWAEEQAVNAVGQNLERLIDARELGKQFMEEINGV